MKRTFLRPPIFVAGCRLLSRRPRSVLRRAEWTRPLDAVPESPFRFAATVSATFREAVETLFYFNERQSIVAEQIKATVEETGSPAIVERDGRLWLELPSGNTQCLFACEHSGAPLGVALYCRPASELLRILHIAVQVTESFAGEPGIATLLVTRICDVARSIKDVKRIQLPYRRAFLRV